MRILIAEGDTAFSKVLKYLMEKIQYSVDVVHTGMDALYFFHCNKYDAVVLDVDMPGMDGAEVLSVIRRKGSAVPVMMLTTSAETLNQAETGIRGADDYLRWPFASNDFVARIRELAERGGSSADEHVGYGDVCLDCSSRELISGKRSVRLNNKEFCLARLFFCHPRYVFSPEDLMNRGWGQDCRTGIEILWTYIGFLRKKMRSLESSVEIRTIRGVGYALEDSRW